MTVVVLASDAEPWPFMAKVGSLAPLLLWTLPVYTVLAMRRVFGRSWTATVFKAFALFSVYMVVFGHHRGGRIRVRRLAAVRWAGHLIWRRSHESSIDRIRHDFDGRAQP